VSVVVVVMDAVAVAVAPDRSLAYSGTHCRLQARSPTHTRSAIILAYECARQIMYRQTAGGGAQYALGKLRPPLGTSCSL
jgi:hypothetical protein